MQAIGYVRVSTVQQATEGVSVEAQWERIAAWCEAHGYVLAVIYVDNGLGGRRLDNRPGLKAALSQAVETQATLVTYSLSRIARSTIDAIATSDRLRKAGADLVSLSEHIDTATAAGKMVFRMLAVLAEFERDLISERTAGAMRHKRARGEYTGAQRRTVGALRMTAEHWSRTSVSGSPFVPHLVSGPTERRTASLASD